MFVVRLLQLGVIPPEALEHKYKNEIFTNEFVLLSYYITSINIEQVYHKVRAEQGADEGDGTIAEDFEGLATNNERAKAEKDSAITVIVMKRWLGTVCVGRITSRQRRNPGTSPQATRLLMARSRRLSCFP